MVRILYGWQPVGFKVESCCTMATPAGAPHATLYLMVMDDHVWPYGLKAKDFIRRRGFFGEDKWLPTRPATDAFKAKHAVATTPQIFFGDQRIGGYDDLRRFLGR